MTKAIFDHFRTLAGGKLTQPQVDKIDNLINELKPTVTRTSQSGIDFIASFEDLRLKAYLCPAKVWTIGFGTTVYPNSIKVKSGDTCTVDQAKSYKQYDLNRFEQTILNSVKVPLNQNQFDALVSFVYNVGQFAFTTSTLLKKLNASDYSGAASEFLKWDKANGKVLAGLTRRRKAESELFKKALK